jgi:hypothetical protein
MAVSGISPASFQALSQQAVQSLGQHKHGGHRPSTSLSDIDAQGSSLSSAPTSTGKVGGKLDVTV